MKTFWDFRAAAPKKAELYLYGEISDSSWFGDEVTPAQFQKDLAALGEIEALDVYINSPGGDVFAGITIYNILKRHPAQKTVHVDGLAASSASIVAMAGDRVVMPKAATLMIHNAWALVGGNKARIRAIADELERVDGQLAEIYAERTGKDVGIIAGWMDAERWMSGEEALADGFADEIEEGKAIAACADLDKYLALYQNPPKDLAQEETPDEDAEKTPDNGEANPQPVADNSPSPAETGEPMENQQKRFFDIKKKILGD